MFGSNPGGILSPRLGGEFPQLFSPDAGLGTIEVMSRVALLGANSASPNQFCAGGGGEWYSLHPIPVPVVICVNAPIGPNANTLEFIGVCPGHWSVKNT